MTKTELKPFWNKLFKFDWKFGLFLIALVCIPRFILVLQANQTGNYEPIGAVMFVSALVPFIFLNKYGRRKIGIIGTENIAGLVLSLILGVAFSFLLFFLGKELYGGSYHNWYQYIGKSYNIPEDIAGNDKLILFSIMATTGMIFSPIGEELFFRGIVHGSFAKSIGEKKASIVDSLAFALTHIAHFGLVFAYGIWNFYPIPTMIWVLSMFLVSIMFFRTKKRTGSLLGAIFCHAGFNLGMIYCIFYLL
ncbi:CPBP family intramembrane metalloprotease [Flavobacterium sediminis]|uniref:CPBP family intramembrane metalloprotease n=1 Tax=Flavobacterium sediminis TaxID=2201181 RepID=A0A2U8QRZ5_9FLAO|nr:type II CAAX endopeptidase family protein [Flavobacterium sediminis]AWM12889.1 CPBP family intramembrane metalloprotease [Flavobacterium sediminis]